MFKIKKKVIAMLLGTFIFAMMFGGNLPYVIFYSFALACIISILHTRIVNKYIEVKLRFDKTVFSAGEVGQLTTIIKNNSVFPISSLEIKNNTLEAMDKKYKGELVFLNMNSIERVKNKIKFKVRGVYNFGSVELKMNDLFYICERGKKIQERVEVKVYPKLYGISQELFSGSDIFGNVINNNRNFNEDLTTVRDVRKYVRGDNLKKIHWKLSAKQGELYVRNFDTTAGEESILFVNMNEDNKKMENWEVAEERMIDFTASLVSYMDGKGIKSEVFINASENQCFTIKKRSDFNELMEFFLSNKSNGEMNFIKFINFNLKYIERFSWIGVITTKIDSQFRDNMIKIKDLGYNMTIFSYKEEFYENQNEAILKRLGIESINYNEILIKSQK